MGTITFKELDTPESFVTKYLAVKVGLNIRRGEAKYNEVTKEWTVPLRAVVPSRVKLNDSEYKTFVYKFEDVGHAIVTKVDDRYKMVSCPSANEIDAKLHGHFYDLTKKMEQTIIKIGKDRWGQLALTRTFLRPLYDILTNVIQYGSIPKSIFEKDEKLRAYLDLLVKQEFVKIDESSYDAWVKRTNMLTTLEEAISTSTRRADTDSVVQGIVGIVFSREYEHIRKNMGNRAPMVYVDTTKAYYLKAVQMGGSIAMTPSELLSSFKLFENTARQNFKFGVIVNELVAFNLLDKDPNENIVANKEVLEQVLPLREEILQHTSQV